MKTVPHLFKIGLLLLSVIILSKYILNDRVTQETINTSALHVENDQLSPEGLKDLFESAPSNTDIFLKPGNYLIDNPVDLGINNISIAGSAKEQTVLLPLNSNYPVFRIDANNITIRQLVIQGSPANSDVRASQAIEIKSGTQNCLITENNISNIATTAILGHEVDGCQLIGNIINNSGADAIRIVGQSIDVIHNNINQYFDEAIDVAGGENFRVIDNTISNGRIAIVLDTKKGGVVYRNNVQNQISEGIVCGPSASCTVINNCVKNSGRIAYNLSNPNSVVGNIAHTSNGIGFALHELANPILQSNTVLAPISQAKDTLVTGLIMKSAESIGYGFEFLNTEHEPEESHLAVESSNACTDLALEQGSHAKIVPVQNSVELIASETELDRKRQERITELLSHYNPGFLSIKLEQHRMESEISQEMLDMMRINGQKSIAFVRAMYIRFSPHSRSSLWYLTRNKEIVAVVYGINHDASVEFAIASENGEFPLRTRIRIKFSEYVVKSRKAYQKLRKFIS